MGKITRVSTVLKRARSIIDEGRWCKRAEKVTNTMGDEKFCAIGATAEALGAVWTSDDDIIGGGPYPSAWCIDGFTRGTSSTYDLANDTLDETVYFETNGRFDNIVTYNDHPKRTRKQMLRMFDKAIERAEADEARLRRSKAAYRRSMAAAK